jgi:acetoacetyl-CoA synthetase
MAVICRNEKGQHREMSWPELSQQVASLALHLKAQGVEPGDRVAAYLPNIPEAMIAFLATVSIGGVWSICAPDMGTLAVLDRFKQIEPKVLIAVDGVSYGGRDHDRMCVVQELVDALPTVQHVIIHDNLGTADLASNEVASTVRMAQTTQQHGEAVESFEPMWLPFDHPLWIVYSSGTTGLPKPIVHGHGGTVIVALALKIVHNDIGCSYHPNSWGERYHWYSSTGWVMWNAQLGGLLNGTTCILYDGNPGGSKDNPDWGTLWRFAAEMKVTFFGAGAAFFANCQKAGVDLTQCGDLSSVRALGTTGSPLSPETQNWGTAQFRAVAQTYRPEQQVPDIWWCNISGGTDFCGAFIGGNRELPQEAGVMQCRLLGCAVEAWNEAGDPVLGEVGELVCTQPIPSMPLYFWGDKGNARYLASYFEMYPAGHGRKPGGGDAGPETGGVWRHGDWLRIGTKEAGGEGCVIFGRSDATINRHGLRMGTSELYSAVEALPEVMDSMVVDLEYLGRESYMPLFVVLREGSTLDAAMQAKINNAIKVALSPRFIPNEIFQVAEIPRTLSGKKQELPIKKLMLGHSQEKVVNKDAMANPACLDWYLDLAKSHLAKSV